jgi:hypothetical protein
MTCYLRQVSPRLRPRSERAGCRSSSREAPSGLPVAPTGLRAICGAGEREKAPLRGVEGDPHAPVFQFGLSPPMGVPPLLTGGDIRTKLRARREELPTLAALPWMRICVQERCAKCGRFSRSIAGIVRRGGPGRAIRPSAGRRWRRIGIRGRTDEICRRGRRLRPQESPDRRAGRRRAGATRCRGVILEGQPREGPPVAGLRG